MAERLSGGELFLLAMLDKRRQSRGAPAQDGAVIMRLVDLGLVAREPAKGFSYFSITDLGRQAIKETPND